MSFHVAVKREMVRRFDHESLRQLQKFARVHLSTRKCAKAHMGTGRVPGNVRALEGCLGTYGHWKGCPDTYGHQKGCV